MTLRTQGLKGRKVEMSAHGLDIGVETVSATDHLMIHIMRRFGPMIGRRGFGLRSDGRRGTESGCSGRLYCRGVIVLMAECGLRRFVLFLGRSRGEARIHGGETLA